MEDCITHSPPHRPATTRYKEMESPSAPSGPGMLLRGGEKRGMAGRTLVVSFSLHQDTAGDAVVISPRCEWSLAVPISILECRLLCSSALLSLLLKPTNGPAPVMKHTLALKAVSWDFQGSLLSGSFGGSRSYGQALLQVVGKISASMCWQQR